MALCDAASKGTPIPETLPPELGKAGAAIAAKPVAQESGGRLGLEEERRRNMEKGEYFLSTHFFIESFVDFLCNSDISVQHCKWPKIMSKNCRNGLKLTVNCVKFP